MTCNRIDIFAGSYALNAERGVGVELGNLEELCRSLLIQCLPSQRAVSVYIPGFLHALLIFVAGECADYVVVTVAHQVLTCLQSFDGSSQGVTALGILVFREHVVEGGKSRTKSIFIGQSSFGGVLSGQCTDFSHDVQGLYAVAQEAKQGGLILYLYCFIHLKLVEVPEPVAVIGLAVGRCTYDAEPDTGVSSSEVHGYGRSEALSNWIFAVKNVTKLYNLFPRGVIARCVGYVDVYIFPGIVSTCATRGESVEELLYGRGQFHLQIVRFANRTGGAPL